MVSNAIAKKLEIDCQLSPCVSCRVPFCWTGSYFQMRVYPPGIAKNVEPKTQRQTPAPTVWNKLKEHLIIEDCDHFAVNHSENFVDPETGAHTQTIEGLWRQCKVFLPTFGMKPKYLGSYIGTFLWHRYCKQRKLDMFIKFLKCVSDIRPPVKNILPCGSMHVAL